MTQSTEPAEGTVADRLILAMDAINHRLPRLMACGCTDPAEVARETTSLIGVVDAARHELTTRRRVAVGQLREAGWSHRQVAQLTGLTVPRAAQLARDSHLVQGEVARHADVVEPVTRRHEV